jgi:hypothetical protein
MTMRAIFYTILLLKIPAAHGSHPPSSSSMRGIISGTMLAMFCAVSGVILPQQMVHSLT